MRTLRQRSMVGAAVLLGAVAVVVAGCGSSPGSGSPGEPAAVLTVSGAVTGSVTGASPVCHTGSGAVSVSISGTLAGHSFLFATQVQPYHGSGTYPISASGSGASVVLQVGTDAYGPGAHPGQVTVANGGHSGTVAGSFSATSPAVGNLTVAGSWACR